jgi:hypothetical protein
MNILRILGKDSHSGLIFKNPVFHFLPLSCPFIRDYLPLGHTAVVVTVVHYSGPECWVFEIAQIV